jgi:hypothetical protein
MKGNFRFEIGDKEQMDIWENELELIERAK